MAMKETQLMFGWMERDDAGPDAGAGEGPAAAAAPGRSAREAWWPEVEAAVMDRYRSWPEAARPQFVLNLLSLAGRLRHELGAVVEDRPGEPLD
jgi:hypothetical protein